MIGIARIIFRLPVFLMAGLILTNSTVSNSTTDQLVRSYTRSYEFDYVDWTLDALMIKSSQGSLDLPRYLTVQKQSEIVQQNLMTLEEIDKTERMIEQIYADPGQINPDQAVQPAKDYLARLIEFQSRLGPLSEAVLERQLSHVLAEFNLTWAGQPIPPPLFHMTPVPKALIVSPRSVIRQDQNISLETGLSFDEMIAMEESVASGLDVSALVVSIGGVGVYPTMILTTTNLVWLTETTAHEWIHNYLTLRPLGLNYETSPELRTINETVASIAGKEIGRAFLEKYYPELAPETQPEEKPTIPAEINPDDSPLNPPEFDFQNEMRITRETTDQLLAAGKIDEAEAYMEERRQFLWENGYQIRRLNQAYFAFHGAYADEPGGAAGDDPVGDAVRRFRAQSTSLSEFINRISWITSFEQLNKLILPD